jgi:VCBS repeat-containing protein
VTFTPATVGSANDSLMINSDDFANPQITVTLQGNGLAAPSPAIAVTQRA